MSNSEVNGRDINSTRIVIGISGASGFQYGVRLLEVLRNFNQRDDANLTGKIEAHLIISKAAQQVRARETQYTLKDVQALADVCHPIDDIACSLASGSYQTLGMIVAPCSMRTLAAIASGVTGNALTRAADVMLKERRRLVLMVRESPLHAAHCENMLKVTQMGAIVAPPVPAFYNHPQTINDIIDHSVGRVLDLFDLGTDSGIVKRWE